MKDSSIHQLVVACKCLHPSTCHLHPRARSSFTASKHQRLHHENQFHDGCDHPASLHRSSRGAGALCLGRSPPCQWIQEWRHGQEFDGHSSMFSITMRCFHDSLSRACGSGCPFLALVRGFLSHVLYFLKPLFPCLLCLCLQTFPGGDSSNPGRQGAPQSVWPTPTLAPSPTMEEAEEGEKVEEAFQEPPLPAEPALRGTLFASLPPRLTSAADPLSACPTGCTLVGKVCRRPDGTQCLMIHPINKAVQAV